MTGLDWVTLLLGTDFINFENISFYENVITWERHCQCSVVNFENKIVDFHSVGQVLKPHIFFLVFFSCVRRRRVGVHECLCVRGNGVEGWRLGTGYWRIVEKSNSLSTCWFRFVTLFPSQNKVWYFREGVLQQQKYGLKATVVNNELQENG